MPEAERQARDTQSQKVVGKLGPRDGMPYQTASKLPVAHQVFLGSWMVDIHQEGPCQRSAPQRRYMAPLRQHSHCAPRKRSSWDQGGNKVHCTWGKCTHQAPGRLSCLDLGSPKNAGPTESVPLCSTQEPEFEQRTPGNCMQPRAHLRQFPGRATWSLSSVDWESTHTVRGGKLSVAQTL